MTSSWKLVRAYQGGDRRAGDELLRQNEGFVRWTVGKYGSFLCDEEDQLQEVRIALLRGFMAADETKAKGSAPIAFASICARNALRRYALANRSDVYVPRSQQHRHWAEAEPTEHPSSSMAATSRLVAESSAVDRPLPMRAVAFDPVRDLGVRSPIDRTEAPNPYGDEAREAELARRDVADLLQLLSARERRVLVRRFGIGDGEEHTLEQIARRSLVTRQCVQQWEAAALAKLRRHLGVGSLRVLSRFPGQKRRALVAA
jgi:RNA polymerase sigma factor (sigma-70 family)